MSCTWADLSRPAISSNHVVHCNSHSNKVCFLKHDTENKVLQCEMEENGCSPFDCIYLLLRLLYSLQGSDGAVFLWCGSFWTFWIFKLFGFCRFRKSKWGAKSWGKKKQLYFKFDFCTSETECVTIIGPRTKEEPGDKSQLLPLCSNQRCQEQKERDQALMINNGKSGEPSACILPLLYVRICQDNC